MYMDHKKVLERNAALHAVGYLKVVENLFSPSLHFSPLLGGICIRSVITGTRCCCCFVHSLQLGQSMSRSVVLFGMSSVHRSILALIMLQVVLCAGHASFKTALRSYVHWTSLFYINLCISNLALYILHGIVCVSCCCMLGQGKQGYCSNAFFGWFRSGGVEVNCNGNFGVHVQISLTTVGDDVLFLSVDQLRRLGSWDFRHSTFAGSSSCPEEDKNEPVKCMR